jgi:hypothetical protein
MAITTTSAASAPIREFDIDDTWVSASSVRNWCRQDPLLDWLELYGEAAGWRRDDVPAASDPTARAKYDPATDFRRFIMTQGRRFEAGVMALLRERYEVHQIAFRSGRGHSDARDPARLAETLTLMETGTPLIYQAPLADPVLRAYGVPDLLIRSDVLAELFPDSLSAPEAGVVAPALAANGARWHYRVIDIKFTTLSLMRDGHAAKDHLPYQVQVWLYNEALGRLQGFTPPSAFLLGRNWQSGSGKTTQRGQGCLERLARIDRDHVFGGPNKEATGPSLPDLARLALDWRKKVQDASIASSWAILGPPGASVRGATISGALPGGAVGSSAEQPRPSVVELYPNMGNSEDAPWHGAKLQIATALAELTRLPGVGVERRNAALARGLSRWDAPGMNAAAIGVTTPVFGARLSAVLAANLLPGNRGAELVLPAHLDGSSDPLWRSPTSLEFFVDFETTSNLDDDFSALPALGGQPLIFQIGCGHLEPLGPGPASKASEDSRPSGVPGMRWVFRQWTVDLLEEAQEARIIDAWLEHMREERDKRSLSGADDRIIHWSPAEMSNLESAYNSARVRHAQAQPTAEPWPDQPFYDLLAQVIHAAPVTVKGAFGFGLKAITHAMHQAGLIEVVWDEGPTDGLGAMVGAWSCDAIARAARRARAAELAASGVALTPERPISAQPLMRSIGAYNQVDCLAMAEILWWLRRNR